MILDQQFVAHLYLRSTSYQGLRDLWDACGPQLDLTEPIAATGLPHVLPASVTDLPPDGEVAVAAVERPGGECQLILRRHHDLLNLSVALAPAAARAPENGDWVWWRRLGHQWAALVARHLPAPLGEVRVHLARADDEPAERLTALLPAVARDGAGPLVTTPDGLLCWETATADDDRAVRHLVVAVPPELDEVASAWVWSRGDTVIPPLARALLHAAKIRYELRVWRGSGRDHARFLPADLLDLRRTVTIAADNLAASGSPFRDDTDLAAWFLRQLEHDIGYTETARERAAPSPAKKKVTDVPKPDDTDYRRSVFVVHGRDEPARKALFDFLRAIGLNPLEWDQLVGMTGHSSPTLSQVIRVCLPQARAVVVLLTPEDVVRLHPELHDPFESEAEIREGMQARPNVLLEMGIALGMNPERTVILLVGEHRPVTDLGGINYIRVTDGPGFRQKLVSRLRSAGCDVRDGGTDWLTTGDFASLTAHRRTPAGGRGD